MKLQGDRLLKAAILSAAAIFGTRHVNAQLGYTLDVTTSYGTGSPGGTLGTLLPFGGPGPDTGFWTIKNNGATAFAGTIGQVAVAGNGNNYNFTSGAITLNPGDSISVAVNNESSNQGGYGGPANTVPQPGVEIDINGLINGSEAVNLSVLDSNIHSGVFQTNPFGVSLDNYVLQGGDPLGRDTGDGFEDAQAPGHFEFFEAAANNGVPDGGATVALLGMSIAGLLPIARRVRK